MNYTDAIVLEGYGPIPGTVLNSGRQEDSEPANTPGETVGGDPAHFVAVLPASSSAAAKELEQAPELLLYKLLLSGSCHTSSCFRPLPE